MSKKYSFLFVAPRFHTNQVHWLNSLANKGHTVRFFSLRQSLIENYTKLKPDLIGISNLSRLIIKFIGDGGSNIYRGFPNPLKYYQRIKIVNPDIIIVRDFGRWFSLLTIIIAKLLKIKVVIYSQTVLYSFRTKFRLLIFNLIFKLTEGIWITPIKGIPNNKYLIPSKLFFVPFAVKIDTVSNNNNHQIEVLSIGKFVERKNHLLLLKCVKVLISKGIKIHLTIIGECSTTEHKEKLQETLKFISLNNLEDQVTIKTNIPHHKIKKYYTRSDIFVLPATNEPASISVVEALGFSLPVICSNKCGTQYYITEDFNGYIFEDNSLDNLIYKMNLMCSEENINRLKENINSTVDSTISEKNYYNTFINLIKSNFLI